MNEIHGMKSVMPRVNRDWCDQILIVDGRSTDGTAEYARKQGYDVVVQQKKGMRHAYIEAMPHIKGDVILTFSPDGNSVPELIPQCIAKMKEGFDMVIVSRYIDGAKSYDDTKITRAGNWAFTTIINLLFGGHYVDSLVIFRAYKKSLVSELDLDKDSSYEPVEKILDTVISWEPLMSVRCAKRKKKVAEIPGDEPKREVGDRKFNLLKWGATYLFQFIREIYYWK
jgi:glycosyltransferase involved in cell wall biosynthesis